MAPIIGGLGIMWLVFLAIGATAHRFLSVKPVDLLDAIIADLERKADAAEAADYAKTEFLSVMSHEIRTPLNGVLGMAELIQGTSLTHEQAMFADTISMSGRSLLGIINNILEFSKIDAGFMQLASEPFELATIAEEPAKLLAPLAEKKAIELMTRVDPSLPRFIQGDPARLRQVVLNIASNAIKFTSTGEVVIEIQRCGPSKAGHVPVRVVVRDTGSGLTDQAQATIFERFTQVDGSYTRSHEGTGLGLAISKGLVELMGGEIGVESDLGQGSTFWFTLGLSQADATGGITDQVPPAADLSGKRVLVVDDNDSLCRILQERLVAWGLDAASVATGKQCLAQLAEAKARARPYHLVLLDRHLRGNTGLDVIGEIRDDPALADTAVVLLSTIDARQDLATYGARRPDAILAKPVGASALLGQISTLLGRAKAPLAARAMSKLAVHPDAGPGPVGGTPAPRIPVLVVDDNATNRLVTEKFLEVIGLPCDNAKDGSEAVAQFRALQPRVILMDMSMPVMNGLQATAAIRKIEGQGCENPVQIIGLTANAMAGAEQTCLDAGMDGYLAKPISLKKLRDALAPCRTGLNPAKVPDRICAAK